MKNFILFILLFFISTSKAQETLSLDPPIFVDTFFLDLSDDLAEQTAFGTLTNESEDDLAFRWVVHTEDAGCPGSWHFLFCDNNFCGSATTISNINPGSDPNIPLEVDAGKTSTFDLTVRSRGSAGCCSPKVTVTTTDNFNEILLTAEYHICVEAITSTSELEKEDLKIYPNPTTGYFYISENKLVEYIRIYDWRGKMVFQHAGGEEHNLSFLPNGIYMVNIFGKNDVRLKAIKLGKI